jgi:hypothetical protein
MQRALSSLINLMPADKDDALDLEELRRDYGSLDR